MLPSPFSVLPTPVRYRNHILPHILRNNIIGSIIRRLLGYGESVALADREQQSAGMFSDDISICIHHVTFLIFYITRKKFLDIDFPDEAQTLTIFFFSIRQLELLR